MSRVVILGAGISGHAAAAYARKWLGRGDTVTQVVAPSGQVLAASATLADVPLSRLHPAEDDGVAVPLDDFLDSAIDDGESVLETRGAGCELPPPGAFVARGPLDSVPPGELIGNLPVAGVENVDAIVALAPDDRPRRSVAIDADQHGWRVERERDCRGNREPGSGLAGTSGDHADPSDEMSHCVFESRDWDRGRDLSKRHRHWATLALSEVRRLAETAITPIQKTLAQ